MHETDDAAKSCVSFHKNKPKIDIFKLMQRVFDISPRSPVGITQNKKKVQSRIIRHKTSNVAFKCPIFAFF